MGNRLDLFDHPWNDVSLSIYFINGNKVSVREVNFTHDDLVERYHKALRDRGAPEESIEDATLTPDEFRTNIMAMAANYLAEPLIIPGNENNTMRVISPNQIREVKVTVKNLPAIVLA